MNPLKRMYSSGRQKRAEKSRKIESPDVRSPSINSFFKMQTSGADRPIPAAAAVVENADTAEEEADVSSLFSDVPTTSKEKKDAIRREEIDITSSSTSTSDWDLFKLDRSFAILIGHSFLPLSHLLPL